MGKFSKIKKRKMNLNPKKSDSVALSKNMILMEMASLAKKKCSA
jgi:hypothetical protein